MAINSSDSARAVSARRLSPVGSDRWEPLVFCLAVLMLTLELATTIGAIVPAGVTGCCGLMLILLRDRLPAVGHTVWLAAFPAFAVMSTLWSGGSSITLYYSIQLAITIFGAFLIYLSVDLRRFVVVVLLASALVCVLSIMSGNMGPSTKGPVLVGLAGSKNSMAACANLAMFTGIAVLVDRKQDGRWRLVALASIPIALFIVATTRAATFILLSGVMPLFLLAFLGINALPVRARLPIVLMTLVIAAVGVAVAPTVIAYVQDEVFTTFGKDPTLTGRTYLWDVARGWASERPWFGWGYKYQWMSYSPGAIGMLRSQQVLDARSFSVHETFLEARVDTGFVGLALLVATIVVGTAAAIWRAIFEGGIPNALSATLLLNLVIRAFGDTLFGPFYAYGPIMIALFCYAVKPHHAGAATGRWRRRYAGAPQPDDPVTSGRSVVSS